MICERPRSRSLANISISDIKINKKVGGVISHKRWDKICENLTVCNLVAYGNTINETVDSGIMVRCCGFADTMMMMISIIGSKLTQLHFRMNFVVLHIAVKSVKMCNLGELDCLYLLSTSLIKNYLCFSFSFQDFLEFFTGLNMV